MASSALGLQQSSGGAAARDEAGIPFFLFSPHIYLDELLVMGRSSMDGGGGGAVGSPWRRPGRERGEEPVAAPSLVVSLGVTGGATARPNWPWPAQD